MNRSRLGSKPPQSHSLKYSAYNLRMTHLKMGDPVDRLWISWHLIEIQAVSIQTG
jgi:hypothetical protein